MEVNKTFICKKCSWSGGEDQLEQEPVETCFGNDIIEICPSCGSMEVFEVKDSLLSDEF